MELSFNEKLSKCLICSGTNIHDSFVSRADDTQLCLGGFQYSYCTDCDYYFINPPPTTQWLEAFYNSHEIVVGEATFQQNLVAYRNKKHKYHDIKTIANFIRKNVPHSGIKENMLDFGCNIGLLLDAVSDRYHGYGIEINKAAREFAIQHVGLTNIYSSLEEIPADVSFDLISLCDVIEHVPNPTELIITLKKRLTNTGHIFLRLPVINGKLFSRDTPWQWKWVLAPYHLSMFSTHAIECLAKVCGLHCSISNDDRFLTQNERILNIFLKNRFTSDCIFVLLTNESKGLPKNKIAGILEIKPQMNADLLSGIRNKIG